MSETYIARRGVGSRNLRPVGVLARIEITRAFALCEFQWDIRVKFLPRDLSCAAGPY